MTIEMVMTNLQPILMGVSAILFILLLIFIIANFRKRTRLKSFGPILDASNELDNINREKIKTQKTLVEIKEQQAKVKLDYDKAVEKFTLSIKEKKNELVGNYKIGEKKYKDLQSLISDLEGQLGLIDLGFHQPVFEYDTSEAYKSDININQEKQKDLVRKKDACKCDHSWSVDGSVAKGKKMTNDQIKLSLRTFNGECNAVIGKVKWNNFESIKTKITRSFQTINQANLTKQIYLTDRFLMLKLEELELTYKYQEKKQEEKEEQRHLNAEIAEQKKAEAEIKTELEKIRKKKIQEGQALKIAEESYQKALDDFKKQFEEAGDQEKELLQKQLDIMESRLTEAKELIRETNDEATRVSSMAEHTSAGYVYIISNLGAFGPNTCKIGMTRRVNPDDRVRELGAAPVPFRFDCHAMIMSDDAPGLEHDLHKHFSDRRINLVNNKKEHFNISLDEIEKWLLDNGYAHVSFSKDQEAKEWRQTRAMIKAAETPTVVEVKEVTEDDLFRGG